MGIKAGTHIPARTGRTVRAYWSLVVVLIVLDKCDACNMLLQNSDMRQMYINAQSEWLNQLSVSTIQMQLKHMMMLCFNTVETNDLR